MSVACGARPVRGLGICELEKGHGGDHAYTDEFGVKTWSSRRGERGQRNSARSRVNRQSAKQAYRQGRLAGIRDERLIAQRRTFDAGGNWPLADGGAFVPGFPYFCECCGQGWIRYDDAARNLALHHVIERSLGARATPDDSGDEAPAFLALVCGSCHELLHD